MTGPASFDINFNGEPSPDNEGKYYVVDTDYDSYAIVYNCDEMFGGWVSSDYFWILARTETLSDKELKDIIEIVEEKIPGYSFFNNDHATRQGSSCPYERMPENESDTKFDQ